MLGNEIKGSSFCEKEFICIAYTTEGKRQELWSCTPMKCETFRIHSVHGRFSKRSMKLFYFSRDVNFDCLGNLYIRIVFYS